MEKLITNNQMVVRRMFNEPALFVAGIFVGPIMMTILLIINMRYLNIKPLKQWIIGIIGVLFTSIFLYSFINSMYISIAVLLASGALLYTIYKRLIKQEYSIIKFFLPGQHVKIVSITPYYYVAFVIYIVIREVGRMLL